MLQFNMNYQGTMLKFCSIWVDSIYFARSHGSRHHCLSSWQDLTAWPLCCLGVWLADKKMRFSEYSWQSQNTDLACFCFPLLWIETNLSQPPPRWKVQHVSCHILPVLVSNPRQTSEQKPSVFISINHSVNKAKSGVRAFQQILLTANTMTK